MSSHIYENETTILLTTKKKEIKTYRQRMIETFDKDPFICPCCNSEMELVEIYHTDYGDLYYYMEDMNIIKSQEGYGIGKKT